MNGKMFRTEEFGTASWKEMTMWVGSSSCRGGPEDKPIIYGLIFLAF